MQKDLEQKTKALFHVQLNDNLNHVAKADGLEQQSIEEQCSTLSLKCCIAPLAFPAPTERAKERPRKW